MCCSDTFTTVVSSTSMKVPSITEMAMIHGLMTGFVDSVIELCCCQTSLAFGSKLSDVSLLPTAQRVLASRLLKIKKYVASPSAILLDAAVFSSWCKLARRRWFGQLLVATSCTPPAPLTCLVAID